MKPTLAINKNWTGITMTVAIFGATSGLGWELSKLFYDRGWNVCSFGRRENRLLGFKAAYCAQNPKRYFPCRGDITSKEDVRLFMEQSIQRYKRVNLIIISSGIYTTLHNSSEDDIWKNVMQTNFWGTYNVLVTVKRELRMNNEKIVVIALSSSLSRNPVKGSAPYSVSKSAVEALILSSKVEWPTPNIIEDLVIISPFRSEMNQKSNIPAISVAEKLIEDIEKRHFNRQVNK